MGTADQRWGSFRSVEDRAGPLRVAAVCPAKSHERSRRTVCSTLPWRRNDLPSSENFVARANGHCARPHALTCLSEGVGVRRKGSQNFRTTNSKLQTAERGVVSNRDCSLGLAPSPFGGGQGWGHAENGHLESPAPIPAFPQWGKELREAGSNQARRRAGWLWRGVAAIRACYKIFRSEVVVTPTIAVIYMTSCASVPRRTATDARCASLPSPNRTLNPES